MGGGWLLPSSLRGKLILAAIISATYIVGVTLYTPGAYQHFVHSTSSEILQTTPDAVVAPRVLLVTSWFPVQNPRFTDEEYAQWLPNFFASNKNDIVLYTTPEYEQKFRSMRGNNLTLIIDTRFASPFHIPPLVGKQDSYEIILKQDRSRSKASIDLYANRHAKPFFLYDAIARLGDSGNKYDFAFWSDAGSFREENVYTEWPSPTRLQEIWEETGNFSKTPKEDLIFIPSSRGPHPSMKFWTEAMGPIDNDISIASFFGGTPNAVDWFTRTYYTYHDHYLSLNIFIGKNQALINSLLFLFPDRFITVWAKQPDSAHNGQLAHPRPTGECGANVRFYYEFWLARSDERKAMMDLWIRKASAWTWWGWWNRIDTRPCVVKEVLSIETVLRSRLGTEWNPPTRIVEIMEKVTLDT